MQELVDSGRHAPKVEPKPRVRRNRAYRHERTGADSVFPGPPRI
jgi:hypothetical protein